MGVAGLDEHRAVLKVEVVQLPGMASPSAAATDCSSSQHSKFSAKQGWWLGSVVGDLWFWGCVTQHCERPILHNGSGIWVMAVEDSLIVQM